MNFKTKTEIQDYIVTLSKLYTNLLLELATGLGKTLSAIRIIERVGGKWIIVIAETNHELNWIEEFKKHNKEQLLENVTFVCYQSLHKVIGDYNYCYDECHHLMSDKRLNCLYNISQIQFNKHNIFLSATMTWKQKESIKNIFYTLFEFKINISKAIELGLLPKPSVYLIPVELDDTKRNLTFNFSKTKSITCTQAGYYKLITDRVNYYKEKFFEERTDRYKLAWLKAGNDRKKFLANCKTNAAVDLVNKLQNKRFICFAGSINQANEVNYACFKNVGTYSVIHSKRTKKVREKVLEEFNKGELSHLFAVGMLKEGMNLSNIEVGIIIQLDNVERYFSQIHGRILRSIAPEQYVLFIENTQDEVYVNTALNGFNMDYVATINLDEL